MSQGSEHFQSVYGIEISHGTIYGWIKCYVEFVCQYLNNVEVKTGERWHADETVVRVKGKYLVLWSMLDGETGILHWSISGKWGSKPGELSKETEPASPLLHSPKNATPVG